MSGPRKRAHGLSLVELLLGLAITALVLAPLVPMLQTAAAAARYSSEQVALEQEADFALERVAARIRATAPPPSLADKPSTDDWLSPAVYTWTGTSLVERQGKETYVLAESVTGFSLAAPATNGEPLITVSLSLARGSASTTAVATVRMGSAR